MFPKDKKVIRATRMRNQVEDQVEWVDQQGSVVDLPKDFESVELVINTVKVTFFVWGERERVRVYECVV